MIILINGDTTIDRVFGRNVEYLYGYNFIQKYYGGKLLDNKKLVMDMFIQDLNSLLSIQDSSIIVFNNVRRIIMDDDSEHYTLIDTNIEMIRALLITLNRAGHRIVSTLPTNTEEGKLLSDTGVVETVPALNNILNQIKEYGLDEGDFEYKNLLEETNDVMSKYEY